MSKISKPARCRKPPTGPYTPIQPKREEKMLPETMKQAEGNRTLAATIVRLVAPVFPPDMPPDDIVEIIVRVLKPGPSAALPGNMVSVHHAAFPYNALHNVATMKPSGYGPMPEGSGVVGDDNSGFEPSNQGSYAGNAFNPSTRPQNMNTDLDRATLTASDSSPSQLSGRTIIAVDLGANSPTEPFCAIVDDGAQYSCITERAANLLAGSHSDVIIHETTPSQRQGQWYQTPAGPICDPEKYVVLSIKAFDPAISPMPVSLLIWKGNGPFADVEVYLGGPLFNKLQAQKIQVKVGDVRGQATDFGTMSRHVGQNGNAGMSSNLPTVLQSDMSLAGAENPPGPATASYRGGHFPSNTSRLCLPLSTIDCGQFLDCSDLGSTQSPMTSLFSETPCSATTVSSLDPTFAPVDIMAGLMKDPTTDTFAGYEWAELDSHSDGPGYEIIDPAMLSM